MRSNSTNQSQVILHQQQLSIDSTVQQANDNTVTQLKSIFKIIDYFIEYVENKVNAEKNNSNNNIDDDMRTEIEAFRTNLTTQAGNWRTILKAGDLQKFEYPTISPKYLENVKEGAATLYKHALKEAGLTSLNSNGEINSEGISQSKVEYLRVGSLKIKNLDLTKYTSLKEVWINLDGHTHIPEIELPKKNLGALLLHQRNR